MSYELYFFKIKGGPLSDRDIVQYLDAKVPGRTSNTDWVYDNENTGVYFSIHRHELLSRESLFGFEPTGLTFHLNYMRPDFFGKEAFLFVKNLVADLGLFILNPQDDAVQIPHMPNAQLLYENWRVYNSQFSIRHFDQTCCYISPDTSSLIWEYNLRRPLISEEMGSNYFVPRVAFFRRKEEQHPIRVSVWAFPGPAVFPEVDYILVARLRKNWWGREREELGMVAYDTFLQLAGNLLQDFKEPGCKVLRLEHAPEIAGALKDMETDVHYKTWLAPLEMAKLYNYKPTL